MPAEVTPSVATENAKPTDYRTDAACGLIGTRPLSGTGASGPEPAPGGAGSMRAARLLPETGDPP